MKTRYTAERASLKDYAGIFRGIRMPWLFIGMVFVMSVTSAFAGMRISMFTGDMVDASGNVPTAQLASFALGYCVMGACLAGSTVFSGVANERINLGLRKKLWRKVIYTKQSCYDADGGEGLVSRVTTDCDFASQLVSTIVSFLTGSVTSVMYLFTMYQLSGTLANYMMLLVPVSVLIPFSVGAGLVAAGRMSAGEVVAFYAISGSVGVFFTNVIDMVGAIRQANGALARVINTMKLPDEQGASGAGLDEPDQDLSFVDVSFGYGQADVLHSVSCRIPKGKVTAVIGSNGSGKSTMFKLIDRLYDPRQGSLRFGEKDAGGYDLRAWRKAFGVVAQGSPLMEGTVRENICYGCERPVSEEELVQVAHKARVYDFVSRLPEGFNTPVAPGGQNFSGGQRQCIAIARAMMCSPDYLLLDEATSNLDAHSERAVLEALEELMKGRTTVVIAHSLSAIRRADHVIVLRDGRVEASGAPKQILEASGSYLSKVMNRKRAELA